MLRTVGSSTGLGQNKAPFLDSAVVIVARVCATKTDARPVDRRQSRRTRHWRGNGGCSQVIERIPPEVISTVVSAELGLAHGGFNTGVSSAGMYHGGIDGKCARTSGDRSHHILRPESIEIPGSTGISMD